MDSYHTLDNSNAHLPPGFRFHPTDEELITYYLVRKVLDSSFTGRAITEVDLNKCEPWELPEKAKMGEKEWYFFSLRDRKYPTGLRTNRATEAGYWKATGKDREIYSSRMCALVGMKKTLVFYRGRAPKGEKSNWVMHEYRLEGKFAYHYLSRSSKDEWVISRVFQKTGGGGGNGGTSGGKKNRVACGVNPYTEVGSPSSTSLPPLLDSSSYTATTGVTDRESCSYDSESVREHVSCFSTVAAAAAAAAAATNFNQQPQYHLSSPASIMNAADLTARFGRNVGLSAFPSLRSLQENPQLPFFSSISPMTAISGSQNHNNDLGGCSSARNWPESEPQKMETSRMPLGATELDCMWTY